MKRLLFISLLLMATTVLFGQTLRITSDPAQPCEGDSVTITAVLDAKAETVTNTFRLYRDKTHLSTVYSKANTVTFKTELGKAGNYYATVTVGNTKPINSNTIAISHLASDFYDTICDGSVYNWNGHVYTKSGKYPYTYYTANGCDSVVTLHLTVFKPTSSTTEQTICSGETFTWNGHTYDKTGIYEYVTTGSNGCDNTMTLYLTVLPAINVGTVNDIVVKTTKNNVDYMLIYKNPSEGLNYQWYKDDVAIKDATDQYYMVESGLPSGSYKVYVSHNVDSQGDLYCGAFSKPVQIIGHKSAFSIFPNPAGEGSEIILVGIEEYAQVKIYAIDGRMIHQFNASSNGELPVHLTHGCYFVETIDGLGNRQIEKLIIK